MSVPRTIATLTLAATLGLAPAGRLCAAVPPTTATPDTAEAPAEKTALDDVVLLMKKAAKLLDTLETGTPTQEEQKKILAQIDVLIEQAKKQQPPSGGGSQQKPESKPDQPQPKQPENSTSSAKGSKPVQDERDISRNVNVAPGEGAPDLKEMWGKLPEAQRDEVMQLLTEPIPQKYKTLLKLYWEAIAEKK